MSTTVLRLLLAIVLGVAAAFGWQLWQEREARLVGHAPDAPMPADATAAAEPPRPGHLYKCVDAGGATTIQSSPCPRGSRTLWVRDTVPEAGDSTVIDATTIAEPPPPTFACEIARRNRDAYRRGENGPVDEDGARLHDLTVDNACGVTVEYK